MKIKIEVPDETHSIMVRCFDDSGLLTNDYFVEHDGLEIIGAVDTISRKEAIEAFDPENPRDWYTPWIIEKLEELPSKQPEIIHCCDCIYYDPEHVEKDGVRYEYKDMPKDAFDDLGTGLVNAEYGINVGGKCCRDYNAGYLEDKRVFVSKQNYCGRAERRTDG